MTGGDQGGRDRGDEPGEERGFRIVDRRGEAAAEEEPARRAANSPGVASDVREARTATGGAAEDATLPAIDFSTFVLSLGTSALMHMGLVADPESGEPASKNLVFARQTIDTLDMLQRKTRGNLESDEAQLLESLLYDLRMRFVEASR